MDQSLQDVWKAAAANPFQPAVGKNVQFSLAFTLLSIGILLMGYFGMSAYALTIGMNLPNMNTRPLPR